MGEYIVDVKFRDLKRQMSFIKDKLKDAKSKRELYHQQRVKTGMPVVSLVGYTSSGKTTLFNLLTNEQKETSADLFTTLSTTSRLMKTNNNERGKGEKGVLIVDTVGFISRLPTYMIDAFKSTLEESLAADLILLLIDCSERIDDIRVKYYYCWKVLEELKVDKSKVLVVLTKADNTDLKTIDDIVKDLQISTDTLIISSKTGYGIHKLKNIIMDNHKSRNKQNDILNR
jgi:GTP-binding protein HflX